MKRWQISLLGGVLITIALVVASNLIKSAAVVRAIYWQCAVIGFHRCLPDEFCEGTVIDFPLAIICLLLTVALYSLLVYVVLYLIARKSEAGDTH